MKAILISVKPQYVAKILNGEKTIEIRKRFPKDYVGWVYVYCTKEDSLCRIKRIDRDRYICGKDFDIRDFPHLNSGYDGKGKVVAKFTLNNVDRYVNGCKVTKKYPTFNDFEKILTPACIYTDELENYCEDLSFYAWHISNLVIFDKPKELSDFIQTKRKNYEEPNVQKPPQSWCYVEGGK